jgi:hypothetical protein
MEIREEDKDLLIKMSKGNPGAIVSLLALLTEGFRAAVERLDLLQIHGTDIYIISSDLANKNPHVANHIIMNTDDAKLKEAASKQDRSGLSLLNKEIEAAEKLILHDH